MRKAWQAINVPKVQRISPDQNSSICKSGDTIGMICPSGYMAPEKMERCISVLQQWGFVVKKGKTLNNQYNYFSGTDEERLKDLQEMLDDENVKAIFCARGGYGLSRIIDELNFDRFVDNRNGSLVIADITLLHTHIYSNFHIASLHAPMAAAFNEFDEDREYLESILYCLKGSEMPLRSSVHII
jgi:muramoyltetrapeptide carboxypeptidase